MPRTAMRETFYADIIGIAVDNKSYSLEYWADVKEYKYYFGEVDHNELGPQRHGGCNATVILYVEDEEQDGSGPRTVRKYITPKDIAAVFKRLRKAEPDSIKGLADHHVTAMIHAWRYRDAGELDPEQCDYIVQLACFDEVRYS
jgi:hypothetical protein